MRFARLYTWAITAAALAVSLNLLIIWVSPPKPESYAQILKNGKVVIDKAFLENIQSQYPPVVNSILWLIGTGALAEWAFPLDVESVVSAARRRSGLGPDAPFWYDTEGGEQLRGPSHVLSSYEGTYWLSHLKLLLDATKTEALPYLSPFGRFVVRDTIIESLSVQLRIVDEIRKHPEIMQETIHRPIVITGPPRSMTTHAQSILAQHPDTLYLRFSESRDPILPSDLASGLAYTDADPRTRYMNMAVSVLHYLRPFFNFMFRTEGENPGDNPQEDVLLTMAMFGSPVFETQSLIPSYSKMWHDLDNKVPYRFMKTCQKLMQWQRRKHYGLSKDDPAELRKRWILKTPEHAGFLRDLMAVYPDAVIVLTHRDPVPVVASFIPMVIYMAGFWNWKMDAVKFGKYELLSLERRLNHLVEQVGLIPADRILHVPFREFVEDSMAVTLKICRFAGLSLSDAAVKRMQDYINQSPREGANRFQYRIDTFGPAFSTENLQKKFENYTKKFHEYV